MTPNSILNKKQEHEEAAKELVNACLRAFPVGSQVMVTKGRGSWEGTVVCEPSWWCGPTHMTIRHNRTGKAHRVSADGEMYLLRQERNDG